MKSYLFLNVDKMLMAYPLDALDPTALNKPAERASFKVASHVSFFNTGVCNNRTLVIVMKKKGLDSLFRTYDPVCGDLRDPRNAKFLTTKTSFLSKAPAWFKLYRVSVKDIKGMMDLKKFSFVFH